VDDWDELSVMECVCGLPFMWYDGSYPKSFDTNRSKCNSLPLSLKKEIIIFLLFLFFCYHVTELAIPRLGPKTGCFST
jgi:hypothetical protein